MAASDVNMPTPPNSSPVGSCDGPIAKEITIGDISRMVTAWDFNRSPIDQDRQTLDTISHRLYHVEPEFAHEKERAQKLHAELQLRLQQYLLLLGFNIFSYKWIHNHYVMILESSVGSDASALPYWMRNMHFLVQEHRPLYIGQDVLQQWSGRIGSGDEIGDGRYSGTLGLFMTHKNNVYGLTAGHVVNGKTQEYFLTHRVTGQQAMATAVIKPASTENTGFQSEVGIVRVYRQDRKKVNTIASRIDMYAFERGNAPLQAPLVDIDTLNFDFSRIRSMNLLPQIRDGLPIFKDGVTTGTTMGILRMIRHEYPPTWNGNTSLVPGEWLDESIPIDTLPGIKFERLIGPNRHRWLGFVESSGTPFSRPGDSGALVYAMDGSVKVPLGLHLGGPDNLGRKYAMFQSLECHLLDADRVLNIKLRFENWA